MPWHYRVDNLLWDGDEIVVLDFQMSSIASGLLDFAYFTAQSLPKELRRERFVFGLMWPIGLMGSYATLDPRGKVLAETMLDRHLSALADTDALSLYP